MANPKPLPDVGILDHLFKANFQTGKLVWVNPPKHQGNKKGKEAGSINAFGYRKVSIGGQLYAAHRLIWKMYYRTEPPPVIDHIDRDKTNNAISNLRECSESENKQNTGLYRDNTSGINGVSWHKHSKAWVVTKMIDGTDYYIGTYPDINDAISALSAWQERPWKGCP